MSVEKSKIKFPSPNNSIEAQTTAAGINESDQRNKENTQSFFSNFSPTAKRMKEKFASMFTWQSATSVKNQEKKDEKKQDLKI